MGSSPLGSSFRMVQVFVCALSEAMITDLHTRMLVYRSFRWFVCTGVAGASLDGFPSTFSSEPNCCLYFSCCFSAMASTNDRRSKRSSKISSRHTPRDTHQDSDGVRDRYAVGDEDTPISTQTRNVVETNTLPDETSESGVEVDIDTFQKTVEDNEEHHQQSRGSLATGLRMTLLCLCLLACVVLAVVLPLYFTRWNGNDRDTLPPSSSSSSSSGGSIGTVVTNAPTTVGDVSIIQYLLNILGDHTDETVLLDSGTSQGEAFAVLLQQEEPKATRTPAFRVLQRYALLVLYFATRPSGWNDASGWSTAMGDECLWYGVLACKARPDGGMVVTNLGLCECFVCTIGVQ